MTLRDDFVAALIENVRQGDTGADLLDRIERLLTIEHGATAPVTPPGVTPGPEPPPPHEEPQETGASARPPLAALSAPDKESPAPSPERKRRGWTPEAREAASKRAAALWAARRHGPGIAIPPRDVDDPQNREAVVSVEASPDAPDETQAAIALPECSCGQKHAVEGYGHWHKKACPLHRHRWQLPSASNGDGVWLATCAGCDETKEHRPYAAEQAYHDKQTNKDGSAAVEVGT